MAVRGAGASLDPLPAVAGVDRGDLRRRAAPPEHRVAVREAAEAGDHPVVAAREGRAEARAEPA